MDRGVWHTFFESKKYITKYNKIGTYINQELLVTRAKYH